MKESGARFGTSDGPFGQYSHDCNVIFTDIYEWYIRSYVKCGWISDWVPHKDILLSVMANANFFFIHYNLVIFGGATKMPHWHNERAVRWNAIDDTLAWRKGECAGRSAKRPYRHGVWCVERRSWYGISLQAIVGTVGLVISQSYLRWKLYVDYIIWFCEGFQICDGVNISS